MDQQALIFVGAVEAFDVGLLLWLLGRTDVWLNAQTEQEATESRREVSPTLAPHPSGIAIKGEHGRQPIAAQKGDHRIKGSLSTEIVAHLRFQQDGGACVHKVAGF